ncbi:MAG: hypothetical protein ACR2G0_04480 [Chthoniobacterales bacterium]
MRANQSGRGGGIIIPKIEFRDASIREAIDFLRQQAVASDPSAENKRGVDIVLRTTSLGKAEAPAPCHELAIHGRK